MPRVVCLVQEHTKAIGDHSSSYLLSEMAGDLRDLLAHWFSPSLLDIQQLTWESPCDIMEKVSGRGLGVLVGKCCDFDVF